MKMGFIALGMVLMATAGCTEKALEPKPVQAAPETVTAWSTDFPAASAAAKAGNKYMLIDFSGSDWCGWCIKLDKEVFSQKAFQDYAAQNLVLVMLDFPRTKPQSDAVKAQNKKLMNQYGVQGFPTVLILNPDGQLAEQTGYRPGGAESYVEHIKDIIARAGKK